MKTTDFALHLSNFINKHIVAQKNLSPNTISSYCTTFKLFIIFISNTKGVSAEKIKISDITVSTVRGFLNWIETERKNGISTQNQRLAAIHAFFRYLMIEMPGELLKCQQILSIPLKKQPKPLVNHFDKESLEILLRQPNPNTLYGLRDITLMSLMYDTGARVQEIIDLKVADIRLEKPAVVTLVGKGRKSRCVPILPQTAELIKTYLIQMKLTNPENLCNNLFTNHSKEPLTRAGIGYILNKYLKQAQKTHKGMPEKTSPHCLRHTKAMHLMQSEINMVYIRDFLGHSSVMATEIYARTDSELKRKALEKAYSPINNTETSWEQDRDLMDWLSEMCK